MSQADRNRLLIVRYYKALEDGDGEALFDLYDPKVIQNEWPNQLKPRGDERGLEQLRADFDRGKGVMQSQTYDITTMICSDDQVAVEALWQGTLAIAVGKLQAGDIMTAHISTFFSVKNGKIASQRNYDCFEPFT